MSTRLKFKSFFKYLIQFTFLEKQSAQTGYVRLLSSETVDTVDLIRILGKRRLQDMKRKSIV